MIKPVSAIIGCLGLVLAAVVLARWQSVPTYTAGRPVSEVLESAPPDSVDRYQSLPQEQPADAPDDDPGWKLVAALRDFAKSPTREMLARLSAVWSPDRVYPHLASRHEQIRHSAINALMYVGDEGSVGRLIECLGDNSPVIRRQADVVLWGLWRRLGIGFETALDEVNRAIEQHPDLPEALNIRAILYFNVGKFEKSAQDCRRVLKLMPNHLGALGGLGQCMERLGRWEEALKAYKKVQKIKPNRQLDLKIRRLEERVAYDNQVY